MRAALFLIILFSIGAMAYAVNPPTLSQYEAYCRSATSGESGAYGYCLSGYEQALYFVKLKSSAMSFCQKAVSLSNNLGVSEADAKSDLGMGKTASQNVLFENGSDDEMQKLVNTFCDQFRSND